MTALLMDGFDSYGAGAAVNTTMVQGPWVNVTSNIILGAPSWAPAATGPYCMYWDGVNPCNARRVLPTPGTHFLMSFRVAKSYFDSAGAFPLVFEDGSANGLFSLNITSTGAIQLINGNPNQVLGAGSYTVIAQTSGPVMVPQNWHLWELEVNTSAHTLTLRVDDAQGTGTPILSASDSRITGTIAQLSFITFNAAGGSGAQEFIDDLFVRDTAGSINNGWLGDRRVATLYADSDTATSGWTPNYYHKFGAGILDLNQHQQSFLTSPASSGFDVGSSDFTMEGFFRFAEPIQATGYATMFSRWDAANNHRSWRFLVGGSTFNGGCLQFDTSTDGLTGTVVTKIQYPWAPILDRWYHIALVRASGQLLLFVDGIQLGLPITDSQTYYSSGAEVLGVGGEVSGTSTLVSGSYLWGWLDETRFTNGVGRYTSSFTPPAAAFTRGSGDADWSQVTLLMGYDSAIVDESSFTRTVTANAGAVQFTPNDGPAIGVYSTVGKASPDDNTFISASLTAATNILTMTTQPSNSDTVTVGTTNGSTAAVYTFKTSISTAFDVLIDTTAQNTLTNLLNAINAGSGGGTKYGTGTTSNFDVFATGLPAGQILVTANAAGTGGNSIPSTRTGTAASWATSTLTGGVNLPGPTNFKFQRPPVNTTLISAMQTVIRSLKTDAGTAQVQTALIAPLGGTKTGSTHSLTVSPTYYYDTIEVDPDTSGPITPTTIINGQFQINRTA